MTGGSTLREREAAIGAAARLIGGLRQGRGRSLFILGEAGLGKTAVLGYASQLASRAGLAVAHGRGHPAESAIPFGLLAEALTEAGGRGPIVGAYRRPGRKGPGEADLASRFYRVLRWLEGRPGAPLLLILDDLHWADPESLKLAVFICRRSVSLPVAVIATARPWPDGARDAALGLADEGCADAQRLAPLTIGAAGALLESRTGRPLPTGLKRRAFELSAGNPLLLEQVATAITQGDDLADVAGPGHSVAGDGLVPARFAGLSPEGMRCAQAAAVLGGRFLPAMAAEVAGLEGPAADAALDSLGRSGLIDLDRNGNADFVHPLFRHSLYDGIAATTRGRLHARAFAACAARGMDALAAEHAIRANLAGDPAAVAVLERAGRAARGAGAPETAARHLDAAVALSGDQASARLLLARAEALLAGASPDRAVAACEHLLARPGIGRRARLQAQWMMGRALVLAGAHERARAAFDAAVMLALPGHPSAAVRVLMDAAFSSWLTAGPAQALPIAGRAVALAAPLGAGLRAAAERQWGHIALQSGDAAGVTAAEQSGPAPFGLSGWNDSFAFSACLVDRLPESDRAFAAARAAADRAGHPAAIAVLALGHAHTLTRMGRLVEALEAVDVATSLCDLVPPMEAHAGAARAYVRLYMGELEESAWWYRRAEAAATARGEWNALLFLWDALGHQRLREGAVGQACELYTRLEATVNRMDVGEPCLPSWARHAISAYLAAGRQPDARRLIQWLDRCAGRLPCRFPRIAAATGRAQLAELDGRTGEADAWFRQALGQHDQVALPLEKVETLIGYGAFLRRSGQLVRARAVLAEAMEAGGAAGAGWLAGLAADELRVAGGRRRRRAPGGLTAQEARVARLVATGASNPQIAGQLYLSVSTVETHLERVYAKLGIRSRHQLTALITAGTGIPAVGPAADDA
jgi:DNA-binding CsgD family transcriptional regulator